jgi:hypothetical protein
VDEARGEVELDDLVSGALEDQGGSAEVDVEGRAGGGVDGSDGGSGAAGAGAGAGGEGERAAQYPAEAVDGGEAGE